jgi:transcription elongation factor
VGVQFNHVPSPKAIVLPTMALPPPVLFDESIDTTRDPAVGVTVRIADGALAGAVGVTGEVPAGWSVPLSETATVE